jgi:hypothetical protein
MESINNIFFHELGHFVALELNSIYYNRSGSGEFLIHPCPLNKDEYCGSVKPKKSKNPQDITLYEIPDFFAVLIYGCLFQSYLFKSQLKNCIINKGREDISKRNSILVKYNLYSKVNIEKLNTIENDYYEYLCKHKRLDAFFKIDPYDYLIETSEFNYKADIEKLKSELKEMINAHYSDYKTLVDKYASVLRELQ